MPGTKHMITKSLGYETSVASSEHASACCSEEIGPPRRMTVAFTAPYLLTYLLDVSYLQCRCYVVGMLHSESESTGV